MTTIYSISPDGQLRYDTVRPEKIAETIKRLKNQGQLQVRVVNLPPVDNTKS